MKVFDLVVGCTGLRDYEAKVAGFEPRTISAAADDHKAYYPGTQQIEMRWTGDVHSGRLLGVQLVGGRAARSPSASTSPQPLSTVDSRSTRSAIST